MDNIVIATVKSWNLENARNLQKALASRWNVVIIDSREELTTRRLAQLNPTYVFFPHWSWIIPEEIYTAYRCVVFHLTDLPFGRGGSPLQNLIVRGIYDTQISAIRVDAGLDTGAVYMKHPATLEEGSADTLLAEISRIIFTRMIPHILETDPSPTPQEGPTTTFQRRTPEESDLAAAKITDLRSLYDFIRMLDGEGYPNAFITVGGRTIRFYDAKLEAGKLTGKFQVD